MIELEWKEIHENCFVLETGHIQAYCQFDTPYIWGRKWWQASVSITTQETRYGPKRCSLAKAQEDAARMIEEKLIDLSIGVEQELKNYGIDL